MRGFVHLHDHMHMSLLDGHQREREALEAAQEQGMTALGFTDHGNCHGHFQAWKHAKDLGMTPILGCEAFIAPSGDLGEPSDRFHKKPIRWTRARTGPENEQAEGKGVAGAGKYTHQTILARDAEGLRNLWRITSKASRDGFYGGRARADHTLLRAHSAGLIATTGCPSGELQTRLRLGQTQLAHKVVERDLEIFGRENYFLEVMDHGLKIEKQVRGPLMEIMKRYSLRPLATNDSHYARERDAIGHDELLAIQTGVNVDSPDRWRFDTDGDCKINANYYLKSPAQMRALFDEEIPGACDNTLLIAEMLTPTTYDEVFTYDNGIRMPHFAVPEGHTPESYLRELVYEGLHRRYGGVLGEEVITRAEYELGQIVKNGFVDYFLVLWDMCRFMRERGILFGPRGSAAGSIVIYSLFIAALDPLRYGLMFERFINPARVSPPDVDVDIEDARRAEVVDYMVAKYGEDLVAGIITFGRLGGKESLRDAAKIRGFSRAEADALSKAYPEALFGKAVFLEDIYDEEHPRYDAGAPLRALIDSEPRFGVIMATARRIEKRLRKWGKHACGLIVGNGPLIDIVPLTYQTTTGLPHVGFEYVDAEEMKLQKLDALGLRNLTILANALSSVQRLYGVEIDVDSEEFDDPAVYALLTAGHTQSVFQLESGGMRQLLRQMKPTSFEDIMAVGALYRPGPMGMGSHTAYALRKNGLEAVTPIHPELADALHDILAPTYGVICFQEQVMLAVQAVAGFTPGEADILRKAMGKKKKSELDKMRVQYEAGALAKGYSVEAADALWKTLEPFADYAFNKAHTACYGRIAYWTAYLKAHFPTEYMAAVLDAEAGDKKKLAIYLAECRRMGIKVLVPDVNASDVAFTPMPDGTVRYGLGRIAGMGEKVALGVVRGRRSGPYRDFVDFLERAGVEACTKKAVQAMIEAGAFDSIEPNRRALFVAAELAANAAKKAKDAAAAGQVDLFAGAMDAPEEVDGEPRISMVGITFDLDARPFERLDQLDRERAVLGLYLSGHPLDGRRAELVANRSESTIELLTRDYTGYQQLDRNDKKLQTQLSGLITAVEIKHRKKDGLPFASVILEDLDGSVEVMFWASVYPDVAEYLTVGQVVAIRSGIWVKEVSASDGVDDDGSDPDAEARVPEVEITYTGRDVKILEHLGPDDTVTVWLRQDRLGAYSREDLERICLAHPGPQSFRFGMMTAAREEMTWRSAEFRVELDSPFISEIKAEVGRGAFSYGPLVRLASSVVRV